MIDQRAEPGAVETCEGADRKGEASNDKMRIALALSGGGSRAIAFHLGCLRGLRQAGLLDRVSLLSSVSGGSVVAALFCSASGDFDAFERATRRLLARGLVRPALVRSLTSLDGLSAGLSFLMIAFDRTAAFLAGLALMPFPDLRRRLAWLRRSPLRRWASRTTILRNVLDALFDHQLLSDLRSDRPKLIIVACELRAKAAIYFTKNSVHCWRYGEAASDKISLANAVAASAAYPLALPALDERFDFQRDGSVKSERVTLTDGGVYDNLGLAPFWPDRDAQRSMQVPPYDRVIACRAGYALEVGDPGAFVFGRLAASFESIHARSQNLAMKRLFELAAAGRIGPFLLPYLGQDDSKLAKPPVDFVAGASVADYPTDFSAMSDVWIDRLVARGETLVAALVEEHWPDVTRSATQHAT